MLRQDYQHSMEIDGRSGMMRNRSGILNVYPAQTAQVPTEADPEIQVQRSWESGSDLTIDIMVVSS
jgi:hypothetical protein